MKRCLFSLLILSTATVASAGEPPIRFPLAPPAPAPAPQPGGVPKLTPDLLYVIDSDVPLLVFASPAGAVKVTKEEGPLRIRGRFVDGTGKAETRTFKGKFVVTIEPAATARAELIVVPEGAKTEADALRKLLDVDDGTKPLPPPVDPDPKPKPDPVTSFRVILVTESSQPVTQAQYGAIYGKAVEEYLTATCTGGRDGWARRDKDTDPATDTSSVKAMWSAAKPKAGQTPCVAVEVNGVVAVHPLPADAAATLALLKKLSGGK